MTGGWLGLLWLIFLLAGGAWFISALLVPLVTRGLFSRMGDPAARARWILLMVAVPWLVPCVVVAAAVATAGSKAIGWIADHCPHHGLSHPHLCFAHLPAVDVGFLHHAIMGLAVMAVVLSGSRLVQRERGAHREINLLRTLTPSRGRLRIVPVSSALALAGGVLEPVVLLSRGLLGQLSFRERRIVAGHEVAHLRHGDPRRNVVFEVLLLAHLPWVRHRLRAQWLRSLEEQADDAVARRFGTERVVETLLHVARINLHRPAPRFSVAGADLLDRARRLLDGEGGHVAGSPAFEIGYALLLAAVFAAAVAGHHAIETLLGLIVGH